MEDAVVELYSVGNANPDVPRPRGIVKEDGTFVLGTYGKDDGAPVGEYAVTIQCFSKPKKGDDGFGKNLLPPKYATVKTSGLKAHIQVGDNTIPTFEITKN